MKYIITLLVFFSGYTFSCDDARLHRKLMQRQMFESYLSRGEATVELEFASENSVSLTITPPKPIHHLDIKFSSSHNIQLSSHEFFRLDDISKLPKITFKKNGEGFSFIESEITAYFMDGTIKKSSDKLYLRELKKT
ncbi:hypothetical protein L1D15_00190 [Vibrio sp. Isolate25]|uniref:hypothetical protein n=1 Tax=Vibrio sp. Isolate25 TaxID=2908535 RepID=UPI001EFD9025|nr:hypothetical protein [Vibrio sp. Isolate25]MCG9595129.1 hypothetical protein [Vibrio sp. Isolate25]